MKSKIVLSFCLFFTLISCVESTSYSVTLNDFLQNHWLTDELKTFNFSIKESNKNYNLSINLSHVYDFQYESVPMTISIIGSDNKKQIINFDLKIKDKSGKDLGDCSGDICDLKQLIKENIALSKGNCKIVIKQNFKGKYLPNIITVGVELKNKI